MARRIEVWGTERLVPSEEWRDVVGFEAEYEISSLGRVRRKDAGRILRPWIAAKRYHYVHLCVGGRKTKRGVHVLVAEAFHGPKPSPGHEVAHWDGVGTHNTPHNVRWATHAENIEDQRRHGTLYMTIGHSGMRGSSHPGAKLRDKDVLEMRRLYEGRRGQLTDLARSYGVNRTTIKRAVVGAIWGSV